MNSFFDPQKTYEENYKKGPFGVFKEKPKFTLKDEPKEKFLKFKINSTFGIPAGPILNANFAKAAFSWGFDLVSYKTVRSIAFPSHPWPNVLFVKVKGQITEDKFDNPVVGSIKTRDLPTNFSITNSFGVPSQAPDIWQPDVKRALLGQKKGQLLILSFMGTKKAGFTETDYVDDFGVTAKLAKETGALVLEVNLSCPNMGTEGLICYDLTRSREICEKIRSIIGNMPLVVKIGYFFQKQQPLLESLIDNLAKLVDGISVINALHIPVVDKTGKQALPGKDRLRSGVCGACIQQAGIDMVKRLHRLREKKDYSYSIIGVGGVITPQDYLLYKKCGANAVQSATGAMWNPYLAYQIKVPINEF